MFPAKGRDSRPATAAMLRLDVGLAVRVTAGLQFVRFGPKRRNHLLDGIGFEFDLDLVHCLFLQLPDSCPSGLGIHLALLRGQQSGANESTGVIVVHHAFLPRIR